MIIVSPTPSVLPSLVRHLISGVCMGLAAALVYLLWTGSFEWEVTVRLVNLGMLLGILRWLLACANLPGSSSADEAIKAPGERPVHRPTPFVSRLSSFLHCPEEDLHQQRKNFTSRMRFWTRVSLDTRCGPKPSWLIRQLLARIRDNVRGNPR